MPAQAVRQYKLALTRAYERDDAEAIADTAYNLALAEIRAGDPKAALLTTRNAQAELQRRQVAVPAELMLVQAAAAYRAGDTATAATAAQQALELKARDADTAPRAWFIRGLVAAGAAMAPPWRRRSLPSPPASRPISRPTGRNWWAAPPCSTAMQVPPSPPSSRPPPTGSRPIDYRGMARALALAGEASLKLGKPSEAAVFYLRAGRSSLLQGDTAAATPQLKRAEELARQTSQTSIVEEIARLRKAAAEKAPVRT